MTNHAESEQRLQELNQLLETYGADMGRWPAADRISLSRFIAINPRAKAAVAEAAALDRLLDAAPRVSVARQRALAERIVTAAVASNPSVVKPGNVVPFRAAKSTTLPFFGGHARHAAGALLAASLVLGIFAGTSGQFSPAVDYVAEATGLSDEDSELAFYAETSASAEESL
ncbi:MAG: hypothetical protein ABL901_12435 [Hyphomicrobiaceae bacterium]